MTKPLRVALVNDFVIVVRGAERMLADFPDRVQIVELDVRTAVATPVDIALFDGYGATEGHPGDINHLVQNPKVGSVVVYALDMQRKLIDAAFAKGVRGYVAKSVGAAGLVEALERVAAGEQVVIPEGDIGESPSVEVPAGDWPGRAEGLSARQAEVISLITAGLSNEEIAASTSLTINTVKTYIRNAYQRMGVSSRTQAVLWGVKHNMGPDRLRVERDPDGDG